MVTRYDESRTHVFGATLIIGDECADRTTDLQEPGYNRLGVWDVRNPTQDLVDNPQGSLLAHGLANASISGSDDMTQQHASLTIIANVIIEVDQCSHAAHPSA
jgi:hypothetical protein